MKTDIRHHASAPRRQAVMLGRAAALVAVLLGASSVVAQTSPAEAPVEAAATIDFAELNWVPLNPDMPDGPAMATLWGDPMTGPYGALLRVPAGFESPMHMHSSGERIVQITGRSVHWELGGDRADAPVLEPGDYFAMPADTPHVSATEDVESIEFITQDGPFDYQPWQPASQ